MFKQALFEMYREKVISDNYYNLEEVEEYCSEHASATAKSLSRDCISLINSKDWNKPNNNLYTFDVAMKDNNITNKKQLLSRADSDEIVIAWFFRCFGSYNLIYNFTDDLNEYCIC